MKKLILPLLLLVAIGMLAAVESDPSAVVGYIKYPCITGLNFIGEPLNDSYATTTELGTDYPTITSIQKWTGTSWLAVTYDPDWGWDDEFALDNLSVLFVYSTAATNVYTLGPVPDPLPQFSFTPGLNTMYVPLNKSALTNTELLATDIADVTSIQKWTGTSWLAVTYDPDWGWDDVFDVTIGMPLFIYKTAAGTYPSGAKALIMSNSK